MPLISPSACLANLGALGLDAGHQIVPGLDEGRRTLFLEAGGERIDVDTCFGEAGQNFLAVATVRREDGGGTGVESADTAGAMRCLLGAGASPRSGGILPYFPDCEAPAPMFLSLLTPCRRLYGQTCPESS